MRNTIKSSLAIFMAFIMLTGTAALAADTAPVAENLELTTYRNTSVGGRMAASAAKGSAAAAHVKCSLQHTAKA